MSDANGLAEHKPRFYELDLFRFLAAMAVVLFHFTFRGAAADNLCKVDYPLLGSVFKYGYLGVHLFFIISGFVILETAKGKSAKQFIMSRCLRLYPAFIICSTLTFLILKCSNSSLAVNLGDYLINFTMLAHFFDHPYVDGAYWSLSIEMVFYFLTLVFVITQQLRFVSLYCWIWLLFSGLYYAFVKPIYPIGFLESALILNWSSLFVAGIVFADIRKNNLSVNNVLLLILSYGLSLKLAFAQAKYLSGNFNDQLSQPVIGIVLTLFYAVFFLAVKGKLRWITTYKSQIMLLGALTYPLYLFHQYVGYLIMDLFLPYSANYWFLVVLVLFMLLFAYSVNQYVEKPLALWFKSPKVKTVKLGNIG